MRDKEGRREEKLEFFVREREREGTSMKVAYDRAKTLWKRTTEERAVVGIELGVNEGKNFINSASTERKEVGKKMQIRPAPSLLQHSSKEKNGNEEKV